MANLETIIIPASTLGTHDWWPDVHAMIIASFKRKDIQAFPPSWVRLNVDPKVGARGLTEELGPNGQLVVLFQDGKPVAASGFLPSRGADWINTVDQPSSDVQLANGEVTARHAGLHPQGGVRDGHAIEDWEICCFNVDPQHRGKGLSHLLLKVLVEKIQSKGGRRLLANYSIEETGNFWPKMGFDQQVGTGSVLPKGFTHTPGMEGLREDLHFEMSAMTL